MQVFDLSQPIPKDAQNSIMAIGNFDGVHLGHQMLISTAHKKAKDRNLPVAVLTFEPHPRRVFRPEDPPFRITPLPLKLQRFREFGIDIVYLYPFDWNLASLSAEDFIQQVLKDKINPQDIIIGEDFHFGHNRTGNIEMLKNAGFSVTSIQLLTDTHHGIISASRIRGTLQSGHMNEANQLLGWPWEIQGIVEHGNKRGREIGYPTANVALGETIHPAYGIYASWVRIEDENKWYIAATNIGIRPMFKVETGLVETHLLDKIAKASLHLGDNTL